MEIAKEASSSEVEVAKKPLLDLSGTLTLADSLVLVKVSDVVDGVAVAAEAESSGATGGLRIRIESSNMPVVAIDARRLIFLLRRICEFICFLLYIYIYIM